MICAALGGRSGTCWRRLMQKLASGGDVALTVGVGEQSIVTDAMNAGFPLIGPT